MSAPVERHSACMRRAAATLTLPSMRLICCVMRPSHLAAHHGTSARLGRAETGAVPLSEFQFYGRKNGPSEFAIFFAARHPRPPSAVGSASDYDFS